MDGQTNRGGNDAFITKYSTDGVKVGTIQFGTVASDIAYALTIGLDGSIYVSGLTEGTFDAQTNAGGFDVYITKFSPDGVKIWTRLMGTNSSDIAYALTTGLDGSIYVSGMTEGSIDGQTNSGGSDAFVTKYSSDGVKAWTRLLGTSGYDSATALTTGLDGSIYVSGSTEGSLNGKTNNGRSDAFLVKFQDVTANPKFTLSPTSGSVNEGENAVFKLTTANVPAGTVVNYSISGTVDSSDISDKQLSGSVSIPANGTANIVIPIAADKKTEGPETLVLNLQGQSSSILINDTSTYLSPNDHTALIEDSGQIKLYQNSDGSQSVLENGVYYPLKDSANSGNSGGPQSNFVAADLYNGVRVAVLPSGAIWYMNANWSKDKTGPNNIDNGQFDPSLIKALFLSNTSAPSFVLTNSTNSVNEGSTATFSFKANNLPGSLSTLYYQISGQGITALDFPNTSLTGTLSTAQTTLDIPIAADLSTEGDETMSVQLYLDPARTVLAGNASSIVIVDTSKSPLASYKLTPSASSVDEGLPAIFNLQTTNLPVGTNITYTLSGVNSSDIISGQLSGTVTIGNNGQASISIPTAVHAVNQGNKNLTLKVSDASASIVLIDKAPKDVTYLLTSTSPVANFGSNAVFLLSTTNLPTGTTVPYAITGSVSSSDLAGGKFTGTTTVGENGVGTISITTLPHVSFQGNKSITVSVNTSSASVNLIDNAPASSPDLYDGKYLSIPKVVSGATTYSNIILSVSPSQIISIGGGKPNNNFDTFDGVSQLLSVPSVKMGSTQYNNATIRVNQSDIVSVNGQLTKPPSINVSDISLTSQVIPNKSMNVVATTDLKFNFSEYIIPFSGSVSLVDPKGKQLSLNVTDNPLVQIAGNQLTLVHSDFYQSTGEYQLTIPSNVIHGVSGGNYPGLNGYSVNIIGLSS